MSDACGANNVIAATAVAVSATTRPSAASGGKEIS